MTTFGDVLVFNQSKVFPARLFGKKISGGKVEVLLLGWPGRTGSHLVRFIGRNVGSAKKLIFDQDLSAEVLNDTLMYNINSDQLASKINEIGHILLPPYIVTKKGLSSPKLKQSYQTVYAADIGLVAALTAGIQTPKSY